jgi:formamidopyrimidine-DNA glycosylase
MVDELVPAAGGGLVPSRIAHIARDPMDPLFDDRAFLTRLRLRQSAVKRALLDQTLVSGIGNIYADESLWRARLSGERLARTLTGPAATRLLADVRSVLTDALVAGGTSFDALYVNVNGQSGYFDRSLAVYGREGEPCPRCGTPVRRSAFMNRSSFFCPRCQRAPRPVDRSRP